MNRETVMPIHAADQTSGTPEMVVPATRLSGNPRNGTHLTSGETPAGNRQDAPSPMEDPEERRRDVYRL